MPITTPGPAFPPAKALGQEMLLQLWGEGVLWLELPSAQVRAQANCGETSRCCAPCAGAGEVEMPSGASGCCEFLDRELDVAFLELGVTWEGCGVTCGCAAVAQEVSLQTCVCCE